MRAYPKEKTLMPRAVSESLWQLFRLIAVSTIVALAYRAVFKPYSLQDNYWQSLIEDMQSGVLMGLAFHFLGPRIGRMVKSVIER